MKKNNVLMENVLKSKKDIQQCEKAVKEMDEALKLLPSQENLDRDLKKIQQGGELPRFTVVEAITKTEEVRNHLHRYIQILQDLIHD